MSHIGELSGELAEHLNYVPDSLDGDVMVFMSYPPSK